MSSEGPHPTVLRAAEREERRSRVMNAACAVVIAFLALWAVYAGHGEDPLKANNPAAPNRPRDMLLTAFLCALGAHLFIRRWLSALLVSGAAFTVLCQLLGLIDADGGRGMALISFPAGALYGIAVAALTAVPFILLRRAGPGHRRTTGPDSW